jgi:hypothetical protein
LTLSVLLLLSFSLPPSLLLTVGFLLAAKAILLCQFALTIDRSLIIRLISHAITGGSTTCVEADEDENPDNKPIENSKGRSSYRTVVPGAVITLRP